MSMVFLSLQVREDLKYMWGLVGWFFWPKERELCLGFLLLKTVS